MPIAWRVVDVLESCNYDYETPKCQDLLTYENVMFECLVNIELLIDLKRILSFVRDTRLVTNTHIQIVVLGAGMLQYGWKESIVM